MEFTPLTIKVWVVLAIVGAVAVLAWYVLGKRADNAQFIERINRE